MAVQAQLGRLFDDYNTQALQSALGKRSPADYRAGQLAQALPGEQESEHSKTVIN